MRQAANGAAEADVTAAIAGAAPSMGSLQKRWSQTVSLDWLSLPKLSR
jgi:hypothetical protein